MHVTWAFALAGLLAAVSAKSDHFPVGAPRPEPKPTDNPYPWHAPPPRPTHVAGRLAVAQPAVEGCDYKIKALLTDPKTALMRAELKSTTHNAVQQVVRDIMAQYMQDHQKVAQCLYSEPDFDPLGLANDNIKRDHKEDLKKAVEDLIRALQVIQDPETQKMMRHKVKETVKKVQGKRH